MQLHLWRSQEVVPPAKSVLGKDKGAPTTRFTLQWRLDLDEREVQIADQHDIWTTPLLLLPVPVAGMGDVDAKVRISTLREFVGGGGTSSAPVELAELVILEARLRELADGIASFVALLGSYGDSGEYGPQESLAL